MRQILLFLACGLASLAVSAAQVRVLALFPGKAMLEIDGQRKVLRQGQSLGEVRLLSATPRGARIEVDGRTERLQLGSAVAGSYAQPEREEIRLLREDGAFHVDALVNGQPVRMLVDTGATTVAMSEQTARRLGIPFVAWGEWIRVQTASGTALGYQVRLKRLKIGRRTFANVKAMVVLGNYPREMLLGMNVIAGYEIDHRGNLMILRSR